MLERRLARLRCAMGDAGLGGLLVGSPVEDTFGTLAASRRYLSGFSGSMGWLLITADEAFIVVDFRYWEQAERESPLFTLVKATGGIKSWLPALIGDAAMGGARLGFEPGGVTVSAHHSIREALATLPAPGRPELVPAPCIVDEMRAIKEPKELALLQRSVDIADDVLRSVIPRIEPGWTEELVSLEIERESRKRGASGLSFPTIVASGARSAMPHARPRQESIQVGEPIVIDMGVRVDGYCSDVTRTVVVGQPDERFWKIYDIVLTAQLAAEELVEEGMSGSDAHGLAQKVISEAGYGDRFGHGLGHGVGMLVHEAPRLSKGSDDVLKEGMVVTMEPGIYLPGWGGVRIEDMVVIKGGRAHLMTGAPKLVA